jgi:DNA-binding CsgD family transcriptional regulator
MDPAADLAANLNNLSDREAYLDAASQLLLTLFPSDHAAWNSLDLHAGTAKVVTYPYDPRSPDVPKMMLDMHDEHPVITSLQADTVGRGLCPLRLSDFVSDLELYRSRAFQDGLSLLTVNRQLMLFTVGSRCDLFHCWSMNRWNHDFSDNEVELAQHIQPMLQLLDSAYAGTPHRAAETATAAAYSLTKREQEVMRLLGQGLKVTAIGHLLGCSPRTVAKHLEHAYPKLGSNNRIDALRRLRGE